MERAFLKAENDKDIIEFYKEKNEQGHLKIKPYWAYGRNAKHARYATIEHFDESEFIVLLVDAKSLITNSNFLEVNPNVLFDGQTLSDSRVSKILYRWDNKKFVDPPELGVRENEAKLSFTDGRHRTKVAFLLGQKQIPIKCFADDVEKIQEILSRK